MWSKKYISPSDVMAVSNGWGSVYVLQTLRILWWGVIVCILEEEECGECRSGLIGWRTGCEQVVVWGMWQWLDDGV